MKKIINLLKKTLLFLVVFLQIALLSAPTAWGDIYSVKLEEMFGMDLEEIISQAIGQGSEETETTYGINRKSVQESMSMINAAPYKTIAPQVQIIFNPPNPKPGEKVTAQAVTSYFNDNGPSLYFTWYLSRDGEKDPDKMKEIAAKIMANGAEYDDKLSKSEWESDWKNTDKSEDSDGYKALFGGPSPNSSKDADDEVKSGKGKKKCYAHDFDEGKNYEIVCKHQFPSGLCKSDGNFDLTDESKWGTNPFNPDTDGDGTKDEADLCGLGQNTISWNYKSGDKIGVIVEGTSVNPTKYGDSSYMVMWAVSKNSNCKIKNKSAKSLLPEEIPEFPDDLEYTEETLGLSPGATPEEIKEALAEKFGNEVEIGIVDFDDCLANNLQSPSEGNAFSKIDVQLSSKPTNPLNAEGQKIELSAFATNSPDLQKTKFTWSFYACDDIDAGCEAIPFSKIKKIGKTVGFGLNTVSFPLGIEDVFDSKKYLKAVTKASVNFDANASNSGVGTIYVPIANSSEDLFKVYSSKIEAGRIIKLKNTNGESYERCADGKDPCPVAEGETIILEGPDGLETYSWIIDGVSFAPENCDSGECKKETRGGVEIGAENTNLAYFKVTNGVGQIHKVNLIAENPENGSKIDMLRSFEVSVPKVKIKPQNCNETTPGRNVLGFFKEGFETKDWCLGEKTSTDYSEKNFFIQEGQTVMLVADFNFASSGKKLEDSFWTIDGTKITAEDKQLQESLGVAISENTLSFIANKGAEKNYVVGFSGYYLESSPDGTWEEKLIEDVVEIKIFSSFESTGTAGKTRILATIFTGLPNYLLFLFKITLLIAIMIFVNWIIAGLLENLKIKKI